MRIAVLGAGNGGQGMAADLVCSGHDVSLGAVPEFTPDFAELQSAMGIRHDGLASNGAPPGFRALTNVTADVAEAIDGAAVVMVVVPAFAQRTYMAPLVECAQPGQIVVFNPGKYASLEFARMLREAGREGEVMVAETDTLVYATRLVDGGARILGIKNGLSYAAFPATDTPRTLETLHHLYPQLQPVPTVLQTSIDDNAPSMHAVSTLLNTSRIEQSGPYPSSYYDITPSVGRVILAVDNERWEVSRRLDESSPDFFEIFDQEYGARGADVYEVIHSVDAYADLAAPGSLRHRYLTEEVPFGLVPVTEFARVVDVATPATDAIIGLACIANETDYRASGRDLAAMGLAGMDRDQIVHYVTTGVA